jgi:hypothetical protein
MTEDSKRSGVGRPATPQRMQRIYIESPMSTVQKLLVDLAGLRYVSADIFGVQTVGRKKRSQIPQPRPVGVAECLGVKKLGL